MPPFALARSARILTQVQPTRLVARARACARQQFAAEFADTWILLVRLIDDASFTATLVYTDEEPPLPPPDGPTFSKVARPSGVMPTKDSIRPPLGSAGIRRMLEESRAVALPIRKRRAADRPFAGRVAVGRVGNCDIVIGDLSISRFHASFEPLDTGMAVVDGGSKNGTFINGRQLERNEAGILNSGDQLRFGSVHAVVCRPEMFWDVVQG